MMSEDARPRWSLPVLLIVALGTVLRFIGLDQQSYWVDEIRSVLIALGGEANSWSYPALNIHGPLHMVLLKIWMMLVGTGEGATRALSAIFGAAALPLFYRVAVPMIGRRGALIGLALLAISPFHLWYSQETRNYALFFDAALLAWPIYLQEIEQRTRGTFVAALGVSLLACLLNLTGFFVVAIYGICALVIGRSTRYPLWRVLLLGVLLLVLLLPWITTMLQQMGPLQFGRPEEATRAQAAEIVRGEGPPGLLSLPYTFLVFTLGFTMGPSVHELKELRWAAVGPHVVWIAPILALFAATALWGLKSLWGRTRVVAAMLIWALTPVLLVALLSQLNLKAANPRYAIPACAPYLMLLGAGVAAIRRPPLRAGLLALLLLISAFSVYRYYTEPRYWRPDGRSVGEVLQAEAGPNDVMVSCGVPEPMEYYAPARLPVYERPPRRYYASRDTLRTWVRRMTAGRERLWYVRIDGSWGDPGSGLLRLLRDEATLLETWSFEKAPLYLFALPEAWPDAPRPTGSGADSSRDRMP